jgi:hypothetical protein
MDDKQRQQWADTISKATAYVEGLSQMSVPELLQETTRTCAALVARHATNPPGEFSEAFMRELGKLRAIFLILGRHEVQAQSQRQSVH